MKTIEQAAKEYYTDTVNYPKGVDSIGAKSIAYRSFNAGVEFAQQWIPVEEDLPSSENYEYERCLWKNANGTIWFGSAYQSQKPTHWRPIERK